MKEQTEIVYEAVELIKYSLECAKVNIQKIKHFDEQTENFKKEFRTFSLRLPRRMGNTSIAIKLLDAFENSFLIANTMQSVNNIKSNYKEIFKKHRERILTRHTFSKIMGSEKNFLIIVDETSSIDAATIKDIFKIDSDFYIFIA